jgi:hypothetical protein
MKKNHGLTGSGMLAVLAAGLLAACASGATPSAQFSTPAPTVSPLPRSSPIFIPTVTSAPAVTTSGSEVLTPTAAGPANALPEQPLFQLAPGDTVTVTHVFSAGTQERQYDNQVVRVADELATTYTYEVSGTAQLQTTTLDQTQPITDRGPVADNSGGPEPITPATLQAAAGKLGFTMQAPGWLPLGYAPAAAGLSYSSTQHWVWQQYFASWGTRKFVWLEFSQQSRQTLPVWNPVTGLSQVGASAQLQPAQVKGQPAEYVAGGWVRTTTAETADGRVRIIQVYQWGNLNPPSVAHLRWAQGDFWFEIIFHGECWQYLCGDKDTLVRIAEALQ